MVFVECSTCNIEKWVAYDSLKAGTSKGCKQCHQNFDRKVPKEYHWLAARFRAAYARCENPADISYSGYGGRGIRMKFIDAKDYVDYVSSLPGMDRKFEVDRIDNDGHYERGNLRWASRAKQTHNRRSNRRILYDNKEMVFMDFVRDYTNFSASHVHKLLSDGLSAEEIVRRSHVKAPKNV